MVGTAASHLIASGTTATFVMPRLQICECHLNTDSKRLTKQLPVQSSLSSRAKITHRYKTSAQLQRGEEQDKSFFHAGLLLGLLDYKAQYGLRRPPRTS